MKIPHASSNPVKDVASNELSIANTAPLEGTTVELLETETLPVPLLPVGVPTELPDPLGV